MQDLLCKSLKSGLFLGGNEFRLRIPFGTPLTDQDGAAGKACFAVQSDEYNVVLKTQVDITVSGTISDIVDINRSDISVYISTESINIEGTYAVPIVCKLATPNENVEIESSVSLVLIQVTKK